ncbi:MAG TPA: DMT family transporter [Acidimicrobiia bacterium]|nr:DMT family transporter [Acidimicrobiia bacterium]
MSLPVTAARSDREQFEPTDWGLFFAMSFIWGSSYLLIDIALGAFHPGLITWIRVGLGALALAVLPTARIRFAPEDRRKVLWLSIVWVGVPFTLFPLAQQYINSAVTGMLNGAVPIFTAVIGGLFFGRPSRGPQRLGLSIGFVGIVAVSLSSGAAGESAFIGVAMVLFATLCYGVATNIAGPIQHKYGSVPVMARMLLLATIWTTPFGMLGVANSSLTLSAATATVVLAVVCTGLAFVLMATLVGRVGGPRASFITYLIPVISLALGVIFRGDLVTAAAIAGSVLVIVGAILASRREA